MKSSSRNRPALVDMKGSLKEVTQRIEQQMVKEALQATGNNRSRAARKLGLTRQGLLNKINRYGIRLSS